jgi:two-component system CheB/CheR fusion protein
MVATRAPTDANVAQHADRALLRELVSPTVFVQERGDVVHIHGRTGLFLEPAQGSQVGANIFNMAREGLQVSLSSGMRQAANEEKEVIHRGVQVRTNGDFTTVDLRFRHLKEPDALRGLFRITFENPVPVVHGDGDDDDEGGVTIVRPPDRVRELEQELQYTKENHQSTIEELETANEELKSTNEELQSTNEELQSANEELETSKEEMQSLNEELQTVNAELQGKVEELSRANNDMKNLLNGTDIATIFLDNDLNIKRYTDQAKRVVRLIPSDVGRPIGDLVSTLQYDHLVDDAKEVLRTLVFRETEVQGDGDAWYLMRILPYRTTENVIDGLVLTFVDITKIRALQEHQRRLLEALKRSPTSVFGHDLELRYTWAYNLVLGRAPHDVEGKTDRELFGPPAEALAHLKEECIESGTPVRKAVHITLDRVERVLEVFLEPVRDPRGHVIGLSGVATDLTAVGAKDTA